VSQREFIHESKGKHLKIELSLFHDETSQKPAVVEAKHAHDHDFCLGLGHANEFYNDSKTIPLAMFKNT